MEMGRLGIAIGGWWSYIRKRYCAMEVKRYKDSDKRMVVVYS
jgi:hypothetical protein